MSYGSGRFTGSGSSYGIRSQRKRRRRTALLAVLAVLILILFVALILIIKDMIERRGKDPGTESGGSDTVADVEVHTRQMAYDGKTSTYYKSEQNQLPGAYFLIELESEIEIGKISVISDHHDCYIRSADIRISSDKETFTTLGSFDGAPDDPGEHSALGNGARASYVMVYISTGADAPWVINEITILDSAFGTVKPRDGIPYTPSKPSSDTGAQTLPVTTSAPQIGETTVLKSAEDVYTGDLILVGASYIYHFPSSEANILDIYDNRTPFTVDGKTVYSYMVGGTGVSLLDATALKHLNAMMDDFYKESGINCLQVGVNAGYRSEATQADLASRYSTAAAPGRSEHNTGIAVNLNIYENGHVYQLDDASNPKTAIAYAWLTANAHKYGFIDRYPPSKDSITKLSIDRFHYRYVGYPHAWYMKTNNLCLEEYLAFLEASCDYSGNHLTFTGDNGKSYEVYFVRASSGATTSIPVPSSPAVYTVSGNNYSGFIVTIEK